MSNTLPKDPHVFMQWNWNQIKPYTDDLLNRPLTSTSLDSWMAEWSDLNRIISEIYSRLLVATTLDTFDQEAKVHFNNFLDETFTPWQAANQELKQKLLLSGLKLIGFEIPLRNIRLEAEIYRETNLALLSDEKKLVNQYDAIIGAQTVEWESKEVTPTQLQPVFLSPDRAKREKAWRLSMDRA